MKSFMVIITILLCNFLYAQPEPPVIRKMSIPNQQAGKPIIYQFPDSVNNLITHYIKDNINRSVYYSIELNPEPDGYSLRLFQNYSSFSDSSNAWDKLIMSCYRYCLINGNKIPIYLESDQEFGFYNFAITGGSMIIYLKRKSFHIFDVTNYSIIR